jgi:hypothetical protein
MASGSASGTARLLGFLVRFEVFIVVWFFFTVLSR